MLSNGLVWVSSGFPDASCSFLFQFNIHSGISKEYMEQKMYLSTHTSEGEQNYIMQVTVQLPLPDSEIDMRMYDNDGNGKILLQYLQVFIFSKCWI